MSDSSMDKVRSLMRRLQIGTANNQILWEQQSDTAYLYARRSSSVWVAADSDGTAPFKLQVYDGDGQVVDEYETVMRATEAEYRAANQELAELYKAARRQALRSDEVLDDLMQDLPPDPNSW